MIYSTPYGPQVEEGDAVFVIMPNTKDEALLWLAERLPDLREPCLSCHATGIVETSHPLLSKDDRFLVQCGGCQGRNWLPKQGRDALHDAMEKAGWDLHLHQLADDDIRNVRFVRKSQARELLEGIDSDDHLAAAKAMKAAGH